MIRVAHILDHSLPEHSGYSFRSHAILQELDRLGIGVLALTGPKQGSGGVGEDSIDGITYLRTHLATGVRADGVVGQLRTITSTRARLKQLLHIAEVDVIHAHSPCLNGIAAIGLGIPLVYEMRSSWEDAAVSVGTTTMGSPRYRLSRALETFAARRADAVAVICRGLERELVSRGVDAHKITVVPNAVAADMFESPSAADVAATRARFGLSDCRVIGFFGSFFEWEGIDALIASLPAVLAAVPDTRVLLAGGGRQEPALKTLTQQRGLADKVIFAGKIPHADVPAFYGAADVMAFPRVSERLTELVTPLKPLEAMAQGRPVVASDVGGHRELISDGQTGFLYAAGDNDDLARKLIDVLTERAPVREVVARARHYVEMERRWSHVAEAYLPIYDRLRSSERSGRQAQRNGRNAQRAGRTP